MKSNNLRTYFDDISQLYYLNEASSFYLTNLLRRKLIKNVGTFEGKRVLDIMSGRGENLKYIDCINTISITTLDYSKNMNILSLKRQSQKKIIQIQNDFFDLDTENKYDIILCSFGIKTIPKKKLASFVKKINHLLELNGEVLLLELSIPKSFIAKKILKLYLKIIVPFLISQKFKILYPYIEKHTNFKTLIEHFINENLKVITYKNSFFCFETLHIKKVE